MKIENIAEVNRVYERIQNNEEALRTLTDVLTDHPMGNSDGRGSDRSLLYSLHLSEFGDGSGFNANLSGSLIQIECIKFVVDKLKEQIEKDMKYIETL